MRAGQALRQKWAQEAERERRARDPKLRAQDAAERAAMSARVRTLARYGRLLGEATKRGEMTVEECFTRFGEAEERSYALLAARRDRILGR